MARIGLPIAAMPVIFGLVLCCTIILIPVGVAMRRMAG
ncbi:MULTISPECIES: YccF domain-containing protein [Blautia]|nr:YccF domain-containing protein [Ruminococcus sp.]MCB6690684.1 YccF domain-containing protein [Blautia wexlerae]NSF39557.1 YccF domain-containing protein [Blautia wexlerae]RHQ38056.1 YccF domain-containing protein [Ruminococcus sp. AF25-28AC]